MRLAWPRRLQLPWRSRRRQSQVPRRLAVGAVVVFMVVVYAAYRLGLQPAANEGAAQRFEVKSGQSVPQIATALRIAGLIRDRNAFITFVNFHGLRGRLKAGVYSLSPTLSGSRVARILTEGKVDTSRLVVPEGSRLSDIRTIAARHGIDEADFLAALAAPHSQSFLATKPAGVSLEGYLFPDSYDLAAGMTATQLVDTLLATFGQRVGSEYVQAFAVQGLNLHQALTIASIVEREVNIPADRPIVAQIFLKRYRDGMPLGSDVTTHYAADLLHVPFSVDLNSPYNTRKVNGLPPGPICSPGLSALDAVAHPAGTDYVYFLTGRDGKTYFARTYVEHQRNIAKYLD